MSTPSEFVHTRLEDGVATVEIDRPDVHNAFNEVVIEELTAAFGGAEAADSAAA